MCILFMIIMNSLWDGVSEPQAPTTAMEVEADKEEEAMIHAHNILQSVSWGSNNPKKSI